jgi:hypothetical protein
MTEHPKALAARQQAEEIRDAKAAQLRATRLELAELEKWYKLKFIDITPHPERSTTGMTIAYRGNKVLQVSVASRNPVDKYSKLQGRLAAARSFEKERLVHLRKPLGIKPHQFLRHVFTY